MDHSHRNLVNPELFHNAHFVRAALLAVLLSGLVALFSRGISAQDLEQVRRAWKAMEEHKVIGHWISRSENPGSMHIPAAQTEAVTKVTDTMYLVTVTDLHKNAISVNGFNDSYRFELLGQVQGDFVLRSLEPLANRAADVAKADERSLAFAKRSKALNFLFGLPWPYLAACPGFRLKILRETTISGRQALEFEFECTPPQEEHSPLPTAARNRPIPIVKNGRGIMLGEAFCFVPVNYSFEAKYQPDEGFTSLEIENEFDFELDKFPVVTKRIERRVFRGESDVTTLVHQYHLLGETPPESEFRLPAFGLPEPEFARQGLRAPIILIALGAMGFALFVVGRKLRTGNR